MFIKVLNILFSQIVNLRTYNLSIKTSFSLFIFLLPRPAIITLSILMLNARQRPSAGAREANVIPRNGLAESSTWGGGGGGENGKII